MNSGLTSERVYETLKRRLLEGAFRPGDRLEPAMLADSLMSSVTPVREALNLLTGETLVESRTGGGFYLPAIDEPGLSDRYIWNGEVVVQAVRAWPAAATLPKLRDEAVDGPRAVRVLFGALAALSTNAEHRAAVEHLSDRLHAVRSIEEQIVGPAEAELALIRTAAEQADRVTLTRLVTAFHRRRARHAAMLVRALYRAG